MFKKMLLALVAAAVLSVPFSGIALASEDLPEGIRVRGEVISIDPAAGKFRVESNQGSIETFFVNDETVFRGKAENLVELEVGWKVGVGARDEDGKLWAVLVLSGDPEDYIKARGKVIDVNTSAGKFTLEMPDGDKMTFFVDDNTRYDGQISSLDDLQEGWHAGVVAIEKSPGKLLAIGLVAGDVPELLKTKGIITSVDLDLGRFVIETDDGRSLSIFVDEKTRYQGQLSSLEDMQVGWNAGVTAKEVEDEGLLAVLVIAGTRPEGVRAQGIIVGVDTAAGKFRLENPDGTVLTFFVDDKTTYKGQVKNIFGLEEGMRAGVGGYVNEENQMIARVVLAGNSPDERPELVKAQGTIKTNNPGAGKFQLEKPDGEVLTVYVDGKTRYKGQVGSYDDLEKGMRVGFAGYIDNDGKIIARIVLAGKPRPDRPEGERLEGDRPGGGSPDPQSGVPLEDMLLTPDL